MEARALWIFFLVTYMEEEEWRKRMDSISGHADPREQEPKSWVTQRLINPTQLRNLKEWRSGSCWVGGNGEIFLLGTSSLVLFRMPEKCVKLGVEGETIHIH